ncbi:hypothetical protein DES53_11591 [Roseimicrobium gellanilyticum]|uniref:Uncharacterized protein n=1 Tax=Roseimicrobium gellanilyticum TaxID=748857 RepID=A0A366H7I8_9BACT|nr:hypothetical protein [Roseimicrobium gellanilyticum]RBP36950.1 hypothetical protein DES53_11591 [Roseimicrobium gellanilyticum]
MRLSAAMHRARHLIPGARGLCLLVLLLMVGIAMAWSIYTWRPRNPLRFHFITQQVQPPVPYEARKSLLLMQEMEVENTSGATVWLYMGRVKQVDGAPPFPAGSLDAQVQISVLPQCKPLIIGPRETVRTKLLIGAPELQSIHAGKGGEDMHVIYAWTTRGKERCHSVCRYLAEHLPDRMARRLPRFSMWGNQAPLSVTHLQPEHSTSHPVTPSP